jgi:PAS domain S-box-containing protein
MSSGEPALNDLTKYKHFAEMLTEGFAEINSGGRFLQMNSVLSRMLGYRQSQLLKSNFLSFFNKDDVARIKTFLNSPEAKDLSFETTIHLNDSVKLEVSLRMRHFISKGYGLVCLLLMSDLSPLRYYRRAYEESEQKYRELFDHAPVGIYEFDYKEQCMVSVNDLMCQYVGYTREELLNMSPVKLLTPDSKLRFLKRRLKVLAGLKVADKVEFDLRHKDGHLISVHLSIKMISKPGESPRSRVVIYDITERKAAESALRTQKQYFQALVNCDPSAIVTFNLKNQIVDINPRFTEIFGFTLSDIEGQNIDEIIIPKHCRAEAEQNTKKVLQGEVLRSESIRQRKDGSLVHVSISGAPIILDGKQIGVVALYDDITERKQAEEKLRYVQEIYRKAIENAQGVPYRLNYAQETYDFVGDGLEELLGVKRKLFNSEKMRNLIRKVVVTAPDFRDRFDEYAREFRKGQLERFAADYQIVTPGGEEKWVSDCAIPLKDAAGQVYGTLGILQDISGRKRSLEEREKIIVDLQAALDKVKTLSDLIPICANCKKIRDDEGYWNEVESYIRKHAGVEFTHGICPECMRKLYPEFMHLHKNFEENDSF